jgi:HEAT repeat protein/cyclophilin family peptidyl-prolyl cis-trans isomerase
MPSLRTACILGLLAVVAHTAPAAQQRRPLASPDIDNIATLLKLEDTRQFDEAALTTIAASAHPEVRRRAALSIGRIADVKGSALLAKLRADTSLDVRATAVFSMGQLKDPATVAWLGTTLSAAATPAAVAREAALALGKFLPPAVPTGGPTPAITEATAAALEARAALASYLLKATVTPATTPVVGEALLSLGRFPAKDGVAPLARFAGDANVEIRWRAAWALFRPRDPAAMPHIMKLVDDTSGDVRFWAVRGLAPAMVEPAGMDRKAATTKLRAMALRDPDRRVRTEALRVLLTYDDENAFGVFANALDSSDTWISVSAAEAAARFVSRTPTPSLVNEAASKSKPTALRITAMNSLVPMVPGAAADIAATLVKSDIGAARTAAFQALGRTGAAGRAKLDELAKDPAMAQYQTQVAAAITANEAAAAAAAARAGGAGQAGRAGGAGGGGGGGRGNARPAIPARPDAEYRALVEKWIVPAYNGQPGPRAIWETPKGTIELELYAGDAPLGVEHFFRVVESGDIVGTEFTRLVPNFVAQQQAIRNASTLRDEVTSRGLTRGNLSWASAGLDTGRPGYTLGNTPQPHNEGNFTALGRVVQGMDVVDKLELGDKITAARIITK